jgi:divalent metal cation (Fe/Co/Zn/Cd) transporter
MSSYDPQDGHEHKHEHSTPGHNHHHSHDPGHGHVHGFWEQLAHLLPWNSHRHDYTEMAADQAVQSHEEGIRTVWLALGALLLTTLIQVVIVYMSGSVALLADTVHNLVDGLNSIPLLIAFYLARRAATRRYSYGFGRAEDVAGIVGFVGNEAVAMLQNRVGRKIGSAAMVADGLHARTEGLTSLAVLLAAGGSWLGYPIVDPIIGSLIGVVILFITRDAIVTMWYRLMDAIEPEYMEQAETVIQGSEGVEEFCRLRMRWIGHRMHAEVVVAVDPNLTTAEGHQIAEAVRHQLFHEIPRLSEVVVHVEPAGLVDKAHHDTVHHEAVPRPLE